MNERRAKGTGSVYQERRPDGSIEWRAEKKWKDADGGVHRVKARGLTEFEAVARLTAKLSAPAPVSGVGRTSQPACGASVHKKRPTSKEDFGRLSFREYAIWWTKTQRDHAEPATVNQEFRILEMHAFPIIGDLKMNQISEKDFKNLFATIKTDGGGAEHPYIMRNVYRVANVMMNNAYNKDHIKKNPLDRIARPSVPKPNRSADMAIRLTKLNGLLAWASRSNFQSNRPQEWARLQVSLLGLRPSEALALTWDCVELTKRGQVEPYILVSKVLKRYEPNSGQHGYYLRPETKTGESRRVPLDKVTADALRAWKRKAPKSEMGLVFCKPNGTHWTQAQDRKRWRDLLTESQATHKKKVIWPIGFNRHIAVTLLLDAGTPQHIVAAMMGHTALVENLHYYAPQEKAQRAALDDLKRTLPIWTIENDARAARRKQ